MLSLQLVFIVVLIVVLSVVLTVVIKSRLVILCSLASAHTYYIYIYVCIGYRS